MRLAYVAASMVCVVFLVMPLDAQQTTWSPLASTGTPSARAEFGFDVDSSSGFYVVFGGFSASGFPTDETWTYDGAQAWTQVFPAQSPPARGGELVFDPGRGVFVTHGGYSGLSGVSGIWGDTWEFDGLNWSQVVLPGPTIRARHTMAYDPFSSEVLLFGGLVSRVQPPVNELWSYDGSTWTNRSPAVAPPGRQLARLVYDAARGVHVLFGGQGATGSQFFNDTWEYSSALNTWTQVLTPNAPPARWRHAMDYDANRGVVVLYGGEAGSAFGDTWEYDGADWSQVTTAATPGSRSGARFAPSATGLVMHGGAGFTDTWEYGGPGFPFVGSGGDCALQLGVNGGVIVVRNSLVNLVVGDTFTLRALSPGGTLDFAGFALIGSNHAQGSPPPGLTLFGSGPADVWIDPANAFVVLDGLGAASSVFVPTLVPGGLTLGPYNVPAGLAGQAVNLQIFAADGAANPVGLSTSNALALQFQ